MEVDYIIVGLGLAGLAFAEALEKNGKSFILFENKSQNSSRVAAGVYNPVNLRRIKPVWDAHDQLKTALPFYRTLEKKLNIKIDQPLDIYRIFASIEEQNNWFAACDKPFFENYLIPEIIPNKNPSIRAPYGLGKIINTGKIDTTKLLNRYRQDLISKNQMRIEKFKYDGITFLEDGLSYNDLITNRVVFCEGHGTKNNPFFNNIPLNEVKGELITIDAPDLKVKNIIKSSVFIIPLGENLYTIGATYNWTDKTILPTTSGKNELLNKLNKIIQTPFEVVDHKAGIRPTTKDRRPILGKHHKHEQLTILNGLGTRGVMLAPKMANKLFDHLENRYPLDQDIAIDRFD